MTVLLISLFIFSCNGCEEEQDVHLLDQDYNLVVGILAPDSVRTYRQEVFFGKILDQKYKDFNKIPRGEDLELNRCLLAIRDKYRGEIEGNDEAEIYIESHEGTKFFLQNVGNGIYRDSLDLLKIEPLGEYNLTVRSGKKTFTSKTTVPDNIQFENVNEEDTVSVEVSPLSPGDDLHRGVFVARINQSELASLYRLDINWYVGPPLGSYARFYHSSNEWIYGFGNPLVTRISLPHTQLQLTSMTIQALDSCYTQMYSTEPPSSASASDSLLFWLIAQEELPIRKRSNIDGADDVAGVFGSFNKTKTVSFFMKAKFPSLQKSKPR